jgi:DNA gyrase/topoisomerase IV subunit A
MRSSRPSALRRRGRGARKADDAALAGREILPFIKLIDDPTHTANEDGTYNLSETQARAILDLRLQRLTQLGVKEVTDELEELAGKIKDYLDILASPRAHPAIISDELPRCARNSPCRAAPRSSTGPATWTTRT